MQGAFHFLKSIIASLTLALVAFLMKYSGHLFVQTVEDPPADVVITRSIGEPDFHSVQRTQTDHRLATWNVGVVTNRVLPDPPRTAAGLLSISSAVERTKEMLPSLAEQAVDLMYATPQSAFQFVPVSVQLNRARGACATSPPERANVSLHPPIRCSEAAFFDDVSSLISDNPSHDVFVFVHGFNVTLENATARAAQMAEDLPFRGVVLVFSWPSAGQATAYRGDEAQAERYFWNLSLLLHHLRQRCPADTRINLLAHSMGNRVTLRAIEALCGTIDPAGHRDSLAFQRHFSGRASSGESSSLVHASPTEIQRRFPDWGCWHPQRLNRSSPPIDNLVLASPDVATSDFRQSISNLRHCCDRIVVYASDSDYALKASRRVNDGGYRAGDSRARLQLDGVHVVRVSGVSLADPLGHSFYGTNTRVLDQLAALFRPPQRDRQLATQPLLTPR